jgi:hypothetical protein
VGFGQRTRGSRAAWSAGWEWSTCWGVLGFVITHALGLVHGYSIVDNIIPPGVGRRRHRGRIHLAGRHDGEGRVGCVPREMLGEPLHTFSAGDSRPTPQLEAGRKRPLSRPCLPSTSLWVLVLLVDISASTLHGGLSELCRMGKILVVGQREGRWRVRRAAPWRRASRSGLVRRPEKGERLRSLGAELAVGDATAPITLGVCRSRVLRGILGLGAGPGRGVVEDVEYR